jgi:hypothetical protein
MHAHINPKIDCGEFALWINECGVDETISASLTQVRGAA